MKHYLLAAAIVFSVGVKGQTFSHTTIKYIDTVGAKIIVIIGDSAIRKINGFVVHVYYSGFFMDWQTPPPQELIYLDEKKKPIDEETVLKYIPLYPLPDRRVRGI